MIPGSSNDHPSFARSFYFAIKGFLCALKTERNIRVMLTIACLACLVGVFVKLSFTGWAVVLLGSGMVISAELINTSIETVVDLASPELHPLAKRAKDIAAASVWILCIFVALAGVLVFAQALI
ncbi:diacylglycerol kinase family protein [Atopobium deltae]|uniref:Putative undecaprenol kinase n=1 Tax=Atopobium deltae TaxID=1393034 RepID=A0A133XSB3_9ACTN|nr:diacylglycerol kinase family protein [Atopobium deltae]KXB33826.1 putative undecaprenol kinase [Atopobium deltae]